MVLYALLIFLMFLFLGVALDLGWYYFNVSRLQNAADAAALAGAQDLIARNNTIFKGYNIDNIILVENKFAGYPDPDEDISTIKSDEVAAEYVRKNLSSDDKATALKDEPGNTYAYTLTDNWSGNAAEVTMTPYLRQDGEIFYYVIHLTEDIKHFLMPGRYEPIPAPVVAVAMLTKKTSDDEDPTEPPIPPEEIRKELDFLEATQVISDNWEIELAKDGKTYSTVNSNRWSSPIMTAEEFADAKKVFEDKDELTDAEKNSLRVLNWQEKYQSNYYLKKTQNFYTGVWQNFNRQYNDYKTGDFRQTGIIRVMPNLHLAEGYDDNSETTRYKTTSNKDYKESASKPDSIVLNCRQDIICVEATPTATFAEDKNFKSYFNNVKGVQFESDWDLRYQPPESAYDKKLNVAYINHAKRDSTYKTWAPYRDLRIHNIYNFTEPFAIRTDKVTASNPQDILWARLESETLIDIQTLGVKNKTNHVEYKSVRQYILNINSDNTVKDANEKYIYRPLCVFYQGPEAYDLSKGIRVSRPVILNLYADFRGIIYAPLSSVLFNPNGHNFYGFIVAKEYLTLATSGGHEVCMICNDDNCTHDKNAKCQIDDFGEVLTTPYTGKYKYGKYSYFGHPGFSNFSDGYKDESDSANLFVRDSSWDINTAFVVLNGVGNYE